MKINQQVRVPKLLIVVICLVFSAVLTQKFLARYTNEQVNNKQLNFQSKHKIVEGIEAQSKQKQFSVKTKKENKRTSALPVLTTTLTLVDSYSSYQTYTGEVVSSRTSEIGFENGGKLVRVLVKEGDIVSQDAPLAQLDTANLKAQRKSLLAQKKQAQAVLAEFENGARVEQIAAAEANVKDIQQQLELEKLKSDRRRYLYSEGAIAKEQLDEINFNRKALQERLSNAQSNFDELKNGTRVEQVNAKQAVVDRLDAEIADLDITIDKSILKSPFNGIVSARNLDEGTVVEAGRSILRLVENTQPKIEIGVPITVANKIQLGDRQQITVAEKKYDAVVDSILPEVDTSTRTRTVVFKLQSIAAEVFPKQTAKLNFIQKTKSEGYWLPITALIEGDKGLWSCYALNKSQKDLTVEQRFIELIETQNERVFVRGTLKDGDEIITNGVHRLVPGQVVSIATEE